jgi:hypothetical protein
LGDDVQSWAARQYLPRIDYWINRDDQTTYAIQPETGAKISLDLIDKPILVIQNGWFDGRLTLWPPHPIIKPLIISFHLNEDPNLFQKADYQALKAVDDTASLLSEKATTYFKSTMVGTRDLHTLELFSQSGINAFYTGCLTLTLQQENFSGAAAEILIVDAHIGEVDLLNKLVPLHIRQKAIHISHGLIKILSPAEKQTRTEDLLRRYANARLVITNRLHCALPCLAFGTPFIWLFSKQDCRIDENMYRLLGNGHDLPPGWDWENPQLSEDQQNFKQKIASDLRYLVLNWLYSQ